MAGLAAYGVTLVGATSGTIVNVTSVSGPGLSLDVEDVTAHDSTGAWEEVVATIVRSGELSFDINYDQAAVTHRALITALTTRTAEVWTLGGPMGAWSFNGFVVGFEPTAPHEGKMAASVRIKPTTTVTVPA